MNKLILAGLTALCLAAGPALSDPVEGVWKTEVDDGAYAHVRIAPCARAFCGTIIRTFQLGGEYQSPNIGRRLIWDMIAEGGGVYKGGKIRRPSNGRTYKSKMELQGRNALKVSGCRGPICLGQDWSRVK